MALPISEGSGATLSSNLIGGEHLQIISPVSLHPLPAGSNFIGLATVVQGAALPAGANYIGLVTVGNTVTVDGSGVTQPVSGTVTANLGATDNAVLDAIQAATEGTQTAVEILDNIVSGSEAQVDVVASLPAGDNNIGNVDVASALPAGANFVGLATIVVGNQPTVDLGATDNAVLDAIQAATEGTQTAVEILDNIVSGSEAQVDVVASLPAGDNNIGNVDIASAIPTGANYIGLATVDVGNTPLVSLPSGFGPMQPVSGWTSLATVYSAAANATLFVPPSGTKWRVKNFNVSTLGRGEFQVKSGTKIVYPPTALATTSGVREYYGDDGWAGTTADESFVFQILSAATMSVKADVRFE